MKVEIFLSSLLVGWTFGRPLEQANEEESNIISESSKPLATIKQARSSQKQRRQLLGGLMALSTIQNIGTSLFSPNAPLRSGIGAATNPTSWGRSSDVQPGPQGEIQPSADGWDSSINAEAARQVGSPYAPTDEQPAVAWDSSTPAEQDAQAVEAQPVVSWDSNSVAVAPSHVDPPADAPAPSTASASFTNFSPSPYRPSSSTASPPPTAIPLPSPEKASTSSPSTTNVATSTKESTSSTSTSSSTRAIPTAPKGIPKMGGKGGPPKGPVPKAPTSRSIAPPSRSSTSRPKSSTTARTSPPPSATTPKAGGAGGSSSSATGLAGLLAGLTRSTTGWGTAAAGPTHAPDRVGPATGWDRHAKTHSFQIILSGTPDLPPSAKSVTPNVDVYDVDLFMTDKSTISTLKRLNKTVICYFSGGTYEPGRPDSRKFATTDMGNRLLEWPSEKWLRLNSTGVRRIMADRIKLASEKGCDAIDPDNVDGFQSLGSGGISLKRQDSISFVRFLSEAAEKYSMATGLKNAMDLIRDLRPYVHFAVNEQCADKRECKQYAPFQKPVFHIEYPRSDREMAKGLNAASRQRYCVDNDNTINKFFHTVIKPKELNGVVQYCDGKLWKTPTKDAKGGRSRIGYFESHDPALDEAASPKDWQNDPAMIQLQEELAKQDGYPYGPGQGSESVVSDSDLLKNYDRGAQQAFSPNYEAFEDDESI